MLSARRPQVFIVAGIVVNAGANVDGRYIGGALWRIPGAPFVDGIGGFASVFVTASFACASRPPPPPFGPPPPF